MSPEWARSISIDAQQFIMKNQKADRFLITILLFDEKRSHFLQLITYHKMIDLLHQG